MLSPHVCHAKHCMFHTAKSFYFCLANKYKCTSTWVKTPDIYFITKQWCVLPMPRVGSGPVRCRPFKAHCKKSVLIFLVAKVMYVYMMIL